MATVSITLSAVMDGQQQTETRSAEIADAIMPYFFAAYRATYGQVESGEFDENQRPVMRDMTDVETFAKYAAGISNGSVANVQNYVREQVRAAADAAVPSITVTAL